MCTRYIKICCKRHLFCKQKEFPQSFFFMLSNVECSESCNDWRFVLQESDDEWDEEEEESEDEEEDYTSSQPPTTHIKPAPAALTALTSAKKERSPSVSSNSLFAEEPEDDLFASKPKTSLPAKTTR